MLTWLILAISQVTIIDLLRQWYDGLSVALAVCLALLLFKIVYNVIHIVIGLKLGGIFRSVIAMRIFEILGTLFFIIIFFYILFYSEDITAGVLDYFGITGSSREAILNFVRAFKDMVFHGISVIWSAITK